VPREVGAAGREVSQAGSRGKPRAESHSDGADTRDQVAKRRH
jgi:hypothetical protein